MSRSQHHAHNYRERNARAFVRAASIKHLSHGIPSKPYIVNRQPIKLTILPISHVPPKSLAQAGPSHEPTVYVSNVYRTCASGCPRNYARYKGCDVRARVVPRDQLTPPTRRQVLPVMKRMTTTTTPGKKKPGDDIKHPAFGSCRFKTDLRDALQAFHTNAFERYSNTNGTLCCARLFDPFRFMSPLWNCALTPTNALCVPELRLEKKRARARAHRVSTPRCLTRWDDDITPRHFFQHRHQRLGGPC